MSTPSNIGAVAVQNTSKGKSNSAFQILLDYLNAKSIGDLITRKNLVRIAREAGAREMYADNIRRRLTASGYLKEHKRRGVFYLIKHPQTITSTQLDYEYYLSSRRKIITEKFLEYNELVFSYLQQVYHDHDGGITVFFKRKDMLEAKELNKELRNATLGRNMYEIIYTYKKREQARSYNNMNRIVNMYLEYLEEPRTFARNREYYIKDEPNRLKRLAEANKKAEDKQVEK